MSGTDWRHSLFTDLQNDLWNVPTNTLHQTDRYKNLMQAVQAFQPTTIVAHSLGAATVGHFLDRNRHLRVKARLYGWPTWSRNTDPRITSFKGRLDPVAVGDSSATVQGWGHGY